ncbi:unnamed protein product [Gordionus sp. m RMFG-2023]|uniref:FAS-associated factor 2-like n=1 Tax=Gordionus sp. m RMFG-2023 TaxID=3053472 RepID=UPI0030DE87D7
MGDVGEINNEHMEMLLQFQDLTGIDDIANCRDILISHDWNLKEAANTIFNDGDLTRDLETQAINNHFSTSNENFINTSENYDANMIPYSSNYSMLINQIFRLLRPLESLDHDPNTEIVARHGSANGGWLDWIYRLFTLPIRFVYYSVIAFFQFFTSILPVTQIRRLAHDPEVEIDIFLRKYEQEYGSTHPTFYRSSYGKALRDAKSSAKYLLVYLHDFDSQPCRTFCRSVLNSQLFLSYVHPRDFSLDPSTSNNLPEISSPRNTSTTLPRKNESEWIIWACDRTSAEGRKVLRGALGGGYSNHSDLRDIYSSREEYADLGLSNNSIYNRFSNSYNLNPDLNSSRSFPYVVALTLTVYPNDFLLAQTTSNGLKMSVVFRVSGESDVNGSNSTLLTDPSKFIGELKKALSRNSDGVRLAREEKSKRETTLTLRRQQDEALEQSLETDRKKSVAKELERKAMRTKTIRTEFETCKKVFVKQAIEELKMRLLDELPSEPSDPQNSVKIVVKLPRGKRLERSFRLDSPLQNLFNFVFCHPDFDNATDPSKSYNHFNLATHYPRKILPCDLTPSNKEFIVSRVKALLFNRDVNFRELLTSDSEIRPPNNFLSTSSFEWILQDGNNTVSPVAKTINSSTASEKINDDEHDNAGEPIITFKDFGLTETTVVYVQDL